MRVCAGSKAVTMTHQQNALHSAWEVCHGTTNGRRLQHFLSQRGKGHPRLEHWSLTHAMFDDLTTSWLVSKWLLFDECPCSPQHSPSSLIIMLLENFQVPSLSLSQIIASIWTKGCKHLQTLPQHHDIPPATAVVAEARPGGQSGGSKPWHSSEHPQNLTQYCPGKLPTQFQDIADIAECTSRNPMQAPNSDIDGNLCESETYRCTHTQTNTTQRPYAILYECCVCVCANKSLDQFEIPWYPSMGAAEVPETTSKLQMHVPAAVCWYWIIACFWASLHTHQQPPQRLCATPNFI